MTFLTHFHITVERSREFWKGKIASSLETNGNGTCATHEEKWMTELLEKMETRNSNFEGFSCSLKNQKNKIREKLWLELEKVITFSWNCTIPFISVVVIVKTHHKSHLQAMTEYQIWEKSRNCKKNESWFFNFFNLLLKISDSDNQSYMLIPYPFRNFSTLCSFIHWSFDSDL